MGIFKNFLDPDKYHGFGKKPPFFEGWYYKILSQDQRSKYAIIPGIILGADNHAFIQLLNGSTGESVYWKFPSSSFTAEKRHFEVHIAGNRFTKEHIYLDIDDQLGVLQGELKFHNTTPWPVSLFSPGIMGWYAWVPRMETYHGVGSLDHTISGKLKINDVAIDFTGGRGYSEKDWGAAFPEAYIWFQSNHFQEPGVSLTASTAIIPWLRSSFRGFICGLWYQGQLYRFATYTGAFIEKLDIFQDHIEWIISDKRYKLQMNASRPEGGVLLGPDELEMGKRINETLSSTVEVRLAKISGEVIFFDTGRHTGLEAHGNLHRLAKYD